MSSSSTNHALATTRRDVVPLSWLVRSVVSNAHNQLHDLIEDLKSCDERSRRTQLVQYFEATRRQFGRLLVLVKWTLKYSSSITRLHELTDFLDAADNSYQTVVNSMKGISRSVGDSLYPMWDIFTALHVMTSGSYRLLPKVIEKEVPFVLKHNDEFYNSIMSRLNDKVCIRLLGTKLPPQLSNLSVSDGMAYATVEKEFTVTVSLRMRGQSDPPLSQDARIRWVLFDLQILVKPEKSSSPVAHPKQLDALKSYINEEMISSQEPIQTLYSIAHSFCIDLQMGILRKQASQLIGLLGKKINVEYIPHKELSVLFWPQAPHIPLEGELASKHKRVSISNNNRTCLKIVVDEQNMLALRHNPPIDVIDAETSINSLSISQSSNSSGQTPLGPTKYMDIDPTHLSISKLIQQAMSEHASQRISSFTEYIKQVSKDKLDLPYESITIVESISSGQDMFASHDSSGITPSPCTGVTPSPCTGITPSPCTGGSSVETQTHSSSTVVAADDFFQQTRTALLITLFANQQILIKVDSHSGRFVMERAVLQNVNSDHTRLLARLNNSLNDEITDILPILGTLKMCALLDHFADLAQCLGLDAVTKPAFSWPSSSLDEHRVGRKRLNINSPFRHCMYIRLKTYPSFFLGVQLCSDYRPRFHRIGTTILAGAVSEVVSDDELQIFFSTPAPSYDIALLARVITFCEEGIPYTLLTQQLFKLLNCPFQKISEHSFVFLYPIQSSHGMEVVIKTNAHSWSARLTHDEFIKPFCSLFSSSCNKYSGLRCDKNTGDASMSTSSSDTQFLLPSFDYLPANPTALSISTDGDSILFSYPHIRSTSVALFGEDFKCFASMTRHWKVLEMLNSSSSSSSIIPSNFFRLREFAHRYLTIEFTNPCAAASAANTEAYLCSPPKWLIMISIRKRPSNSQPYFKVLIMPSPHPFVQHEFLDGDFDRVRNLEELLRLIYISVNPLSIIMRFVKSENDKCRLAGTVKRIQCIPCATNRVRLCNIENRPWNLVEDGTVQRKRVDIIFENTNQVLENFSHPKQLFSPLALDKLHEFLVEFAK